MSAAGAAKIRIVRITLFAALVEGISTQGLKG